MKKSRTYTFSYNIPIRATWHQFHFLFLHDFFQLWSDFPSFSHLLSMNEMVATPLARISVNFPLLVNIQICQMIWFGNLKFFSRCIRIFFASFRPVNAKKKPSWFSNIFLMLSLFFEDQNLCSILKNLRKFKCIVWFIPEKYRRHRQHRDDNQNV